MESPLHVEYVRAGRSPEREPEAGLDIFMMRHPWSKANQVMPERKEHGDDTPIPDLPPDRDVPLSENGSSDRGALQEAICDSIGCSFDGREVTPYLRGRQAVEGFERMPDDWTVDTGLQERDFGDLTLKPHAKAAFLEAEQGDPDLTPPGSSQSLRQFDAQVADWLDRVRERGHGRFFAMTHDNVMQRAAYQIEGREVRPPRNGEMWQYTNRDPETGIVHDAIKWKRRFTRPPQDPGSEFQVSEWEQVA